MWFLLLPDWTTVSVSTAFPVFPSDSTNSFTWVRIRNTGKLERREKVLHTYIRIRKKWVRKDFRALTSTVSNSVTGPLLKNLALIPTAETTLLL